MVHCARAYAEYPRRWLFRRGCSIMMPVTVARRNVSTSAGSSRWTEQQLVAILDAEKDGHGHEATWSQARLSDGSLLWAGLHVAVTALGHDLHVRAEWKGPTEQQIIMQFPGANWNLLRLCLTSHHPGSPHWHRFENYAGIKERKVNIPGLPSDASAMDTLLSHFIVDQKIVRLVRSVSLF